MTAIATRTPSHTHMRPVVRPLPRPAAAIAASVTW
jgi:hypothetical protein